MYNYCTLFNSSYLTRGLAMYESLKKYSDKFHLYIFAFDGESYELLKKLHLEHVTIVSLDEFEDEKLLSIKGDRSVGEYCWTCTPSIIKYSLESYNLSCCTYLDADLWFFSNPSVLIEEMNDKSVLITEHRYTKVYDQSAKSGIYCVQFMTFKNDTNGMIALSWWRDACIEWCFEKFEDGKFGDQKYLDNWVDKFKGIHVLQNLGGGVAPWNVQQYDLANAKFKLIFYHFHDFKFLANNKIELGSYNLRKIDIETLYKPYARHLEKISKLDFLNDDIIDYNGTLPSAFDWKIPLRLLKRKIKGTYNIIGKEKLLG